MPGTRVKRQVQGRPRRNVVDDDQVGVYHVWSRCVRRAWLCGLDPLTGNNWSHRKSWFFERLQELTAIFAIDACVWAILSNHYHLILRNRPDLAAQWTDEEVVRRWWQLCPERKDEQGRAAEPTDLEIKSLLADPGQVAEWRKRLSSVSWFMKSLNEWFSRRANAEEGARGHFLNGPLPCVAPLHLTKLELTGDFACATQFSAGFRGMGTGVRNSSGGLG